MDHEKELKEIKKILSKSSQGLTVSEIAEQLNMNRNSAAKYLEIMNVLGELDVRIIGPAKIFSISKRIPFCSMMEQSRDTLTILDEKLNIVEINKSAAKLLGQEKEKLIGGHVSKYVPAKSKEIEEMEEMLMEVLEGEEKLLETKITIKGKEMHRSAQFIPTVLNDGTKGVVILGKDITERKETLERLKESQERLKSAISMMEDLFFVFDKDGKYVEYYQPADKPELYTPPEVFLGKSYKDLLPKDVVKKIDKAIMDSRETGKIQEFDYELNIEGKINKFRGKVSAFKDKDGNFVGTNAVARKLN